MKEIKKIEQELLAQTCEKYDLSFQMVKTLLKTAEKNTYENKQSNVREKEIMEYIEFHIKSNRND